MRCGAVVPAAGSSQRMGALDKTLALLSGRPAISWVIEAILEVPAIVEIVIVTGEGNAEAVRRLLDECRTERPILTCAGGATRQASVAAGVSQLSSTIDLVLIHDAARPLLTRELIERGIALAAETGSAVAALPVVDTIKQVTPDGLVLATPERTTLVAVQTPQVFRRDWLEAAYRRLADDPFTATDEASLIERAGFPVHTYRGSPENLKLTNKLDVLVAETLLTRRQA